MERTFSARKSALLHAFDQLSETKWHFLSEFRDEVEYVANSICDEQFVPVCKDVFRPFRITDPKEIKVILLNSCPSSRLFDRTPYADGFAFSARYLWKRKRELPKDLSIIYDELKRTHNPRVSGDLTTWASKGVLPLNLSLTCTLNRRSHVVAWINFMSRLMSRLYQLNRNIVLCFVGSESKNLIRQGYITDCQFPILYFPHPFNRYDPFIGSDAFLQIDNELKSIQVDPIDWSS